MKHTHKFKGRRTHGFGKVVYKYNCVICNLRKKKGVEYGKPKRKVA